MNERLRDLRTELQDTVDECGRFCYAARAREFQVEAIEKLETLKSKTSALKAEMVAIEDEDSANQLLSFEEMLQALIFELTMWVAFKDDDAHAAWTALIEAQSAGRTAMQAHEISGWMDTCIERLHVLEHLLFPPQTFVSMGMIIRKSSCSICGREYGECDHVKGKAYMGQMCARVIEEFEKLETSIVSEPANKHCRMIAISDGDITRDLMTWRSVPTAQPGEFSESLLQHCTSK